ncbi:hypothetical protein RclHR1_00170032 [Rhizophagus clarus]|uniref:Uncharacterized protein n=1 Tax=Rhizophagus clarus TaxID=94130 RepID=A0A2Z6RBW8_9GLOM|nr:hypothetical protein RclHR1_00170032 [Rhizophagus clarus]
MELLKLFKKYFRDELDRADNRDDEYAEKVHIITTITPTEVKLKELSVILIVDGLQTALINQNDGMKKESLFYSLMTEISILVTNKDSPFVIACCTATLARPFHEMVALSH